MASLAPNSFYHKLGQGLIDFDNDVFKISLHTSTLSFNVDTMDTYGDLTNECPATGNYVTTGFTATLTWAVNDTTNQAELTCADITISNATIADYQYAVLYLDTGSTGKYVIRTFDFGSAKSVSGSDLTLSFPNDVLHLASA